MYEVEIQDKRLRETKVLEKEISKSYIGWGNGLWSPLGQSFLHELTFKVGLGSGPFTNMVLEQTKVHASSLTTTHYHEECPHT